MSSEKDYSTYAVKLDGEVKQELQILLEGYKEGTTFTAGDFIKTLLEVYKVNKIVNKVSGTEADIRELNTLTNRIYGLYSNLLERNQININNLQIEFAKQLLEKDLVNNNSKTKIQGIEKEYEDLQIAYNSVCGGNESLEKSNSQLAELNNSYKLNVSKLQEKFTDLLELKDLNKKLVLEVEEYKKLVSDDQAKKLELSSSIKDKDNYIEKLNNDIVVVKNEKEVTVKELNDKNMEKIQFLMERSELQKDKFILELKAKHQEELQKLTHNQNIEIQEYQNKYKMLLDQLEQMEISKKSNIIVVKNKS